MESTLGVKYDLIMAPRSHILEYLRQTLKLSFKNIPLYLQSARSEKKKKKVFLRKRLTVIDFFEGL